MATYTSNYELTKPLPTELYDIEVQNSNMDKLDVALGNKSEKIAYSTEEVLTGDTWIDGKPIYRRVFEVTVATSEVTKDKIVLENFAIDKLIRLDGIYERTGDTSKFTHAIPYYNSATRYFLPFYDHTNSKLLIQVTTAGSAHLIVEYTKSDD